MNNLPPEIINLIVEKVENLKDFLSLYRTCKLIQSVCNITKNDRKYSYLYIKQKERYENDKHDMYIAFVDYLCINSHYLELIKWVLKNTNEEISQYAFNMAAYYGNLEILKWLYENRPNESMKEKHHNIMDCASTWGHLEVVQWLHENRTEGCTKKAMDLAAKNGQLEMVKWLHKNRTEGCTVEALLSAANNGHLKILKCLLKYKYIKKFSEVDLDNVIRYAIQGGNLDIVQWLYKKIGYHTKWWPPLIDWALLHGNLSTVQWLYEIGEGKNCSEAAMVSALERGNLDAAVWLQKKMNYNQILI